MKKVNPALVAVFLLVVALVVIMKISNPHKKYSRQAFWRTATVQDVHSVPKEALARGNKNGPVLMWAASATNNPDVISALVERGANVNESDVGLLSGTPLSAAAAYSDNPLIIDELIKLGAEINKVVGSNDKTPLIIAAELNKNPKILERLIEHGADIEYRDLTGRTALEQAKRFKNLEVVEFLENYLNSQGLKESKEGEENTQRR